MPGGAGTGGGGGAGGGMIPGLGDDYLNQNPTAAFFSYFAPQLSKRNNFGDFLRSIAGDYYNRYQAQAAAEPSLRYLDFLGQQNPQSEFQMMSPQQRGERPSQYAPPVRWANIFGGR